MENRDKLNFVYASAALLFFTTLWLIPSTQSLVLALDEYIFKTLNGTLSWGKPWQVFWGILNHRKESQISAILAVFAHLAIIWYAPAADRKKVALHLFFLWICYEIIYVAKDYFFVKVLEIRRASPSLVFKDQYPLLSELLNNSKIKDSSSISFPSGHAMFSVFWGLMSYRYMQRPYNVWCLSIALFMLIPRTLSGAHWFTDMVYSCALSVLLFALTEMMWSKVVQIYNKKSTALA